jgi:hypothetical protein
VVIVLDAVDRSYPLIHPDWVFSRALGDSIEKIITEERRLFYVALTRAVDTLIILTEQRSSSPFLDELRGIPMLRDLDWSQFPPLRDSINRLTVKVGNQAGRGNGSTFAIKDQLQAEGGEPAEALSEQQIVELGTEVGLSPQHLRQALAEERTRVGAPPGDPSLLTRIVGAAGVSASRTLRGPLTSVRSQLDDWMQREECLRVKRHFPDRIVWEARQGFFDVMRRGLDVGGRGYVLSRAHEVSATIVPVDGERVLVRLDADFGNHRSSVAGQGATLVGLGAVSSGVAAVLGVLLPVALVPAVAAGAIGYYQARRRQARTLSRAQLALEQVLDRLERGDVPRPSLLGAIAAATSSPRNRR